MTISALIQKHERNLKAMASIKYALTWSAAAWDVSAEPLRGGSEIVLYLTDEQLDTADKDWYLAHILNDAMDFLKRFEPQLFI